MTNPQQHIQPSQGPNIVNNIDQLGNTVGRYSVADPAIRNSLNEQIQESATRGRKNSTKNNNNLEKINGHPDSAAINKIRLAHLVKRPTMNRKDSL